MNRIKFNDQTYPNGYFSLLNLTCSWPIHATTHADWNSCESNFSLWTIWSQSAWPIFEWKKPSKWIWYISTTPIVPLSVYHWWNFAHDHFFKSSKWIILNSLMKFLKQNFKNWTYYYLVLTELLVGDQNIFISKNIFIIKKWIELNSTSKLASTIFFAVSTLCHHSNTIFKDSTKLLVFSKNTKFQMLPVKNPAFNTIVHF